MPIKTNITGSTWPTSGTATAGSTGLSAVTTLTHVGSTDVPPGSLATGYLATATGSGGTFRIDPASGAGAPFDGSEAGYAVRFLARAVWDKATALPADTTNPTMWSIVSGSTKLRANLLLRGTTVRTGLSILPASFLSGATQERIAGATGALPTIRFNRWFEVVIRLTRGNASIANCEMFVNGQLHARLFNGDVDGEIALSDLQGDWTITLPAMSGVQWQLAGPIESWSSDLTPRPRYDLEDATSHTRRRLNLTFFNIPGAQWQQTAATASVAITTYASSGINPGRNRLVVSGSAGQTLAIKTYDALGELAFTDTGWANLVLPMTYLPGGATWTLAIRNAADTADVIRLRRTGGNLIDDLTTTTLAGWSDSIRYALVLSLSRRGEVRWGLIDQTGETGVLSWGGVLAGSVATTLGPVTQAVVVGSSGSPEMDGAWLFTWLDLPGIDSMTAATANGVSPNYYCTANHLALRFDGGAQTSAFPDGDFPFDDLASVSSQWVNTSLLIANGRPGRTRDNWDESWAALRTNLRGIRWVQLDGGSINNLTGINAGDPVNTIESLLARVEALVVEQVAVGNRVLLTTMARRELAGDATYTEQENQGINLFNAGLIRIVQKHQANGRIALADTSGWVWDHGTLYTAGDPTHFNAAGSNTVGRITATRAFVPERATPPETIFIEQGRALSPRYLP